MTDPSLPVLPRGAGQLGRLPARVGAAKLPLRWAHEYLTAALPVPTYPIDVSEGLVDFGMGGNDAYGDCGPVGVWHLEMTTAMAARVRGPDVADASVPIALYTGYTGATTPPGPGVDLAGYLLWLFQRGLIKAFAIVDARNRSSCDAFMAAGFGLYGGYQLTDDFEAKFNAGAIATVGPGEQPNPAKGHCMLHTGATGPLDTDTDTHITWARKQPSTVAFTRSRRDEAFLVITTEEQLALFTPALLADVTALGGTGGAPPIPGPTPPPPKPGPAPSGCLSIVHRHGSSAAALPPTVTRQWLAAAAQRVLGSAVLGFLTVVVGAGAQLFSATTLRAAEAAGIAAGAVTLEALIANVITPATASVSGALKGRRAAAVARRGLAARP